MTLLNVVLHLLYMKGGGSARSDVFYETLTAGYFNENFHVDQPQTFHTSDRRLRLMAPALQAHVDYTPILGMS